MHQKVGGSIPDQGTYLVCRFNAWSGSIQETNNQCILSQIDISLSLTLPSSLCKINLQKKTLMVSVKNASLLKKAH